MEWRGTGFNFKNNLFFSSLNAYQRIYFCPMNLAQKKKILVYFCLLAPIRTCLISLAMQNLFQKNEEFKSCCFTHNMEVLSRVMERTTDHMTLHVFVSTQKAIRLKRIYMISKDFTYFSIPSNLRLLNLS